MPACLLFGGGFCSLGCQMPGPLLIGGVFNEVEVGNLAATVTEEAEPDQHANSLNMKSLPLPCSFLRTMNISAHKSRKIRRRLKISRHVGGRCRRRATGRPE